MELRWYQRAAVDATYNFFRSKKPGAPCVVLPTGAGKTKVLATMCADAVRWGGRALVLTHVKELLLQARADLVAALPDVKIGLYSAGLGERTTDSPVVVAGIQSVFKRGDELGEFNLIVVDEAHLIPDEGDGMYRTFLSSFFGKYKNARLVGLTATPFRLGCGWICGPDKILTEIVFEVGVRDLIREGFLSPLKTKNGRRRPDFSDVEIRGGEFVAAQVAKIAEKKNVVGLECFEIAELTKERKKTLVFCASVESAKMVAKTLGAITKEPVEVVTGETPSGERSAIVERFKNDTPTFDLLGRETPPLKYLCNVNVLTTGLDAPNVDCVVLMRPTESVGLYHQMVGRGLRKAPGKTDCLVLDYGQNVVRLGPIDMPVVRSKGKNGKKRPAMARECPECATVCAIGYSACPECGAVFPARERGSRLDDEAGDSALLDEGSCVEYEIDRVAYSDHEKKGDPNAPHTLQVGYEFAGGKFVFEWLCPEHSQEWLRDKYKKWWRARSHVVPPDNATDAANLAESGALSTPIRIRVTRKPGKTFKEIEWLDATSIPAFDPGNAAQKASVSGFEEFDEYDVEEETKKPSRSLIYGVCSGCLAYSDGWCGTLEKIVDANAPRCDDFVINDDDIPF